MRVSLLSALAFLGMMGVPSSVSAGVYPTHAENLKDPYSGHDTLLDLNVNTNCLTGLELTVTLPTTESAVPSLGLRWIQGNAYFIGPSFDWRPIVGKSEHSGVNQHDAGLWLKWDNSTKQISFKGFSQDNGVSGTAVPATVNGVSLNWWNLNFITTEPNFVDPTTPGFVDDGIHVPLTLVPMEGVTPGDALQMKVTASSLFDAYNIDHRGTCGPAPPCIVNCGGGSGDPIFSGFQGQNFQFHGLPDEHFNLVSSPDVQLNSHFVYLSSGKCDYNDTECFTHPGTYMDVLGLSIGETHVKVVAGTHEQGLRVWVNDAEIQRGTHLRQLSTNVTGSLRYHHNGKIDIHSEIMGLEIVNSDMFMNIRASLNNQQLLRVGSTRHTVTDKAICKTNSETHNHQQVEQTVSKKYPVTTQLHGLIGQTWRNVKVCGRDWMGTVQDYLVSDLFASDNHYNYFKW